MITEDDVKLYKKGEMFWVEGTQLVHAVPEKAWSAIAAVMLGTEEIETLGKAAKGNKQLNTEAPLITQGYEVHLPGIVFNGLFSIPIIMMISQVQQPKYCRIEITTLKQHFADVDFLIEPTGDNRCQIRYRQGFYYRKNFLGWMSKNLTLKSREIPETVNIFNNWEKHILAG